MITLDLPVRIIVSKPPLGTVIYDLQIPKPKTIIEISKVKSKDIAFIDHKRAITKTGEIVYLETKIKEHVFSLVGKDNKTIQKVDYLPKSLAPDDTNIHLSDSKYIIIIYNSYLEVWDVLELKPRKEIKIPKFAKVITWGMNLIVVTVLDFIFIYSVDGELLKKIPNYTKDLDSEQEESFNDYDIYQTIILPNGKLASYFETQGGADYFLVEWDIRPYYPGIRGTGESTVISESLEPGELVKIRNSGDGEHYYLLEVIRNSIIDEEGSKMFIYDSRERKQIDLSKYVKEPEIQEIREKKVEVISDLRSNKQYLRHIFAFYNSVVILSYYDSSLIFDLYRRETIRELPFAIRDLHRISEDRFIILAHTGIKKLQMKEINKNGDIIVTYPYILNISTVLHIPDTYRRKVEDTLDIMLKAYLSKNLQGVVKRFLA